jgi:hypothetical protein
MSAATKDRTVVEELTSLRQRGFVADFSVTPGGLLRCGGCGQAHRPGDAVIESTARFEGARTRMTRPWSSGSTARPAGAWASS